MAPPRIVHVFLVVHRLTRTLAWSLHTPMYCQQITQNSGADNDVVGGEVVGHCVRGAGGYAAAAPPRLCHRLGAAPIVPPVAASITCCSTTQTGNRTKCIIYFSRCSPLLRLPNLMTTPPPPSCLTQLFAESGAAGQDSLASGAGCTVPPCSSRRARAVTDRIDAHTCCVHGLSGQRHTHAAHCAAPPASEMSHRTLPCPLHTPSLPKGFPERGRRRQCGGWELSSGTEHGRRGLCHGCLAKIVTALALLPQRPLLRSR